MNLIFKLIILSFFGTALNAQPLLPNWSDLLLGKWRVDKMNNELVDADINMFLEFTPDKLLMINPQSTKEAEWRVNEADRVILIKNENEPIEAWQLRYIDSTRLAIFDTLGFTTLYLSRYQGKIPDNLIPVSVSKSQICGTWLLVNIDNQPIPPNVNLELSISAFQKLKVKVGPDVQLFKWKLNNESNGIKIQQDSTVQKDWIFMSMENDRMSFMDNGRLMNFTRYNKPLTKTQESLLSAKWTIAEVEAVALPNSQTLVRYMELRSDGKMYFYTNDKKEGEGSWGINSSKTGLFVLSGGGTEQWTILQLEEKELLLEMEGLKMLLTR
jgi:hypothetical protein